jgi:hypothetical protein
VPPLHTHKTAGEASSNTFTSANSIYLRGFIGDQPLSQFAGANATLPALLREAQPYLRLILLLRDPVDRWADSSAVLSGRVLSGGPLSGDRALAGWLA